MKTISLKKICMLLQGINLFENCSWIHFSSVNPSKSCSLPVHHEKNLSRPIFQLSTFTIIKKSYDGGAQSTQVRYHIKYLYLLVQETWETIVHLIWSSVDV